MEDFSDDSEFDDGFEESSLEEIEAALNDDSFY